MSVVHCPLFYSRDTHVLCIAQVHKFWESKHAGLNVLHEQLQGAAISAVYLELSKVQITSINRGYTFLHTTTNYLGAKYLPSSITSNPC